MQITLTEYEIGEVMRDYFARKLECITHEDSRWFTKLETFRNEENDARDTYQIVIDIYDPLPGDNENEEDDVLR